MNGFFIGIALAASVYLVLHTVMPRVDCYQGVAAACEHVKARAEYNLKRFQEDLK